MNPNTDAAGRQLRQAHEVLAEQPAPAVRRAVLRAAAARMAPAAAAAPGRLRPWWRMPIPVAGLASAAVALLAVGVALLQQAPPRPATATLAESAVAEPAALPAPGAKAGAAARTTGTADAAPPAVAANAAGAGVPAAPAPQRTAAGTTFAEVAGAEPARAARQANAAARATAAPSRADADAGSGGAAAAAPVPAYRASARTWLAHIVELRRQQRQRDADEELALLRAAHPAMTIPPAALRPQ